jgi:hypothetical protein
VFWRSFNPLVLSAGFVSLTVCSMAQERVVIAPNGATQSSVREVVATGFGINPQKAEEQALMAAVRSAIGVYLDAKTIVANEDVIQNRILSLSNGFVKEYAAIKRSGPSPDGLYEVTIAAKVESSQLMSAMKAANIVSGEIQGRNLWAESATKIKGVDDAVQILQSTIRESCEQLIKLRFLDQEGSVTDKKTPAKTSQDQTVAELTWYVATSVDQETYFKKFAPLVIRCLQNITNTKGRKFDVKMPSVGMFDNMQYQNWHNTRNVPFKVAYRKFDLSEVIGQGRDLCFNGACEPFVVGRASKASDFGVVIEVLNKDGDLLGKGRDSLPSPFNALGENHSGGRGEQSFSGVGPFVVTAAKHGHLYVFNPVRAVSLKVPIEDLKDVHQINCFLEIPEIKFKVGPSKRR